MKLISLVVLSCSLLGGCAAQQAAERSKAYGEGINQCLSTFPKSNSVLTLQRIQCMVDAENSFIRPTVMFADLLDLKQAYQLAYARKVSLAEMTPDDARIKLAEVSTKLTSVFEERRNARLFADSRAMEAQAASTNALLSGLALVTLHTDKK